MPDIKASPRNGVLGALSDIANSGYDFASKPFGYNNPPARMIMDAIGVPEIQRTLNRMSYGDSMLRGSGMATRLNSDAVGDALMAGLAVVPLAGPAAKVGKIASDAVIRQGMEAEKALAPMVTRAMDRGGLPAEMLQAMANKTISPATVWHGSPHKFDAFDSSKIGTGEGAQAYGHGLYLAESPDVANSYRTAGDMDAMKIIPRGDGTKVHDLYIDKAAKDYDPFTTAPSAPKWELAISGNDPIKLKEDFIKSKSSLYKVDLPDEHIAKFLDWDKPLSGQPANVQEAWQSLGKDWNIPINQSEMIGNTMNRAMLEKEMQKRGVPGVRYLDGGSRGAGAGTSNYVVFPGNEGLLNILERNGAPIPSPIQKEAIEKFVYPQDKALATAQRNAALPVSEGGLGLRADNAPMERAEAMGFDTEAWHGTDKTNIKSLKRSDTGAQGSGVYLGDHPMVADSYAGDGKGANIIPALLRGKYAGNMEFSKEVGNNGWKGAENALKASGNSGIHDTMFESAYNVFEPKNIRSRFAAFDPMRRNEADLLGGALPLSALTDDDNRKTLADLLKPMEYAKGGAVTRLTTGDGRDIAHFAEGGPVQRFDAGGEVAGPGYTATGDEFDFGAADRQAQAARAATAQADYTAAHAMSREDFLKKYGNTFVADDKGGNAASEVAGQNVGAYYDRYLAPGAKQTQTLSHGLDSDPTEERIAWGEGKYSDAHPYFDGYDNVNPHPTSQRGNGLDEAWRQIGRPVATAVAMYYGVGALGEAVGAGTAAAGTGGAAGIGSGTALGGATIAAPTATGLAGTLGMAPGYMATALNTGALNTGMSLVRGNNIGDSLKSGVTGALLSPISSYVGDAVGGGYTGQIAGNTVLGGVQGAVNGQGFGKGLQNGLVNGLVSSAGTYMGGLAKGATGNNFAGTAANSLTQSTLRGKDPRATLDGLATQYAAGEISDLSGLDPKMAEIVVNLARNKKVSPVGALTALASSADRAVGSKKLSRSAVGG